MATLQNVCFSPANNPKPVLSLKWCKWWCNEKQYAWSPNDCLSMGVGTQRRLMTMCLCTGWIRYSERVLGSLVTPHICTARSPQQIMGCLVKDYFSKQQVSLPARTATALQTTVNTSSGERILLRLKVKPPVKECASLWRRFLWLFPSRSWVRRKSTTCWWPPASTRSWRLSERSSTTACWRPEM